MKKKLRILAITLAAAFVFAACDSSGDDGAPPPPPPVDNPAKGEMTKETAEKIFVTSDVEGGVQIDQFKDLTALTAYIDAGSQAAGAPSGPRKAPGDKTLVLNKIAGVSIVSIANDAFNPDAKEGTAKLTGFNVKLPETLKLIGENSFKGAGIITLFVSETAQTALGDALTTAASNADAEPVAVADEEDDAPFLFLGDGVYVQPDGSLYISSVIFANYDNEQELYTESKWVGVWDGEPWEDGLNEADFRIVAPVNAIKNGRLTIRIPVPASFHTMDWDMDFNPADMKIVEPKFFIMDDKDDIPTKGNSIEVDLIRDRYNEGGLWYPDKPGTITGESKQEQDGVEFTETVNINLRKGWNFVIGNSPVDPTKEGGSVKDGSAEGFSWRLYQH